MIKNYQRYQPFVFECKTVIPLHLVQKCKRQNKVRGFFSHIKLSVFNTSNNMIHVLVVTVSELAFSN